MRKVLTLTLAATTAISAVAFSTAASAYDYRDYYRGHDNNDVAGAAIAAGVVGFILGAALASSSNHHSYDNGYYNGGYYNRGYSSYGYNQPYYGGYGQPYYGGGYSQPYYGGGYYGGSGYGYQRCYTTRSWDRYYGGYTTRRICR